MKARFTIALAMALTALGILSSVAYMGVEWTRK